MKIRYATLWSSFANLRIRSKVLVLIFLIMAASFMTAIVLQQYAYSTYDRQLHEKSSQVLNLYASGIEDELKQIEQMTFSVLSNPQIQEYLGLLAKPDLDGYERLQVQSKLVDQLVRYSGSTRFIQSITMVDSQNQFSSAGEITAFTPQKTQDIRRLTTERSGELVWIYPGADANTGAETGGRALIAARQIRSYDSLTLEDRGTLMVRINFESLVDQYVFRSAAEGGALVIRAGERLIYPLSDNSVAVDAQLAQSVGDLPVQDGYRVAEWQGRQTFVSRMKSNYSSWEYYQLIPYNEIFDQVVWMKRVLVLFFALSLVVVVAIALSFSASITKPIEELIHRMKRVQMGDFRMEASELASSAPPGADEVGQLHRTFRMMLQQIDELITENYAKQLTIKETQFRALQAQINPHFLYNTLDSINWLAKVNGQQQIASMVESLGFLLRSSISMTKPLIPLREELEMVKHYITIQKFRFEERLDFRMDVPESMADILIPKLTLQPLLENAIHYALEPSIEPCRITITADVRGDDLMIAVSDDGPGMSPDVLEQVRLGQVRTRGTGIGLLNIDERIKLSYGNSYGLIIESEAGAGTKVILHLPRREAGESL